VEQGKEGLTGAVENRRVEWHSCVHSDEDEVPTDEWTTKWTQTTGELGAYGLDRGQARPDMQQQTLKLAALTTVAVQTLPLMCH
jgi:hypothetical protein